MLITKGCRVHQDWKIVARLLKACKADPRLETKEVESGSGHARGVGALVDVADNRGRL